MTDKTPQNEQFEEGRTLARAIVTSLDMWSDPFYFRFLNQDQPGALDADWFERFAGEWGVARTIKKEKVVAVRRYLDDKFRRRLASRPGASAVDEAARHIQDNRWSAQERKDGKASLPLSLVSKIGFFFRPADLVPYDNYARRGLDRLRGKKKLGGAGFFRGTSYAEYLEAFDDQFSRKREQIHEALMEPWVTALAGKFGCPSDALASVAMERKTFDNFLMFLAGRGSRDSGERTPETTGGRTDLTG